MAPRPSTSRPSRPTSSSRSLSPTCSPASAPTATLSLSFAGSAATPGQPLQKDAVGTTPVVTVSSVDGSALDGSFTIAMVDADVVGTDDKEVNRHWLVNSVTVADGAVSDKAGKPITAYAGPGPASGSGPHRYVVLLYQQPSTFAAPADLSDLVPGVSKFDLNAYAKDSGLGNLVAATYFTVEVGTGTISIPATTPVNTATLTASKSGSTNGSTTKSGGENTGSKTSGGAPDPTKSGSASSLRFEAAALALVGAAGAALL
ncbi:phosphatidylethanolamine-binding protein [Mycena rebaudengoi]|nr:phosphatidylethanolamine-binding protein [Mycena rebaudengoi]